MFSCNTLQKLVMKLNTRKNNLPSPTGPYGVSCADLMTEFSEEGIFLRLHYPTTTPKTSIKSDQWIPWIPHDKYVKGLAIVVGVWVLVVRLAMWWYGGHMHIHAVRDGQLLPKSKRGNRKLPVVIFSHGFGATRFLSSGLMTELASQGYIVASLEHRDSSASATYYYKSSADRDHDKRTWIHHSKLQFGAHHYPLRNKQLKYRRDECIKALDFLEEINSGKTSRNILNTSLNLQEFEDQLDLDRVTIMGHSFGGATALLSLTSDSRFKQGVILDGWMFPLKEESLTVTQPLLFINTPTFHIASNVTVLEQFINNPPGAHRQLYIVKNSTHETQTDTPLVAGYWLDTFKPKIDPALGTKINGYLVLKFLHPFTDMPEEVEGVQRELERHDPIIVQGRTPSPVPVHRGFSFSLLL